MGLTKRASALVPPRVVAERVEPVVFIGRPSVWSNPYRIKSGISRADSLRLFEAYARSSTGMMSNLDMLTGKDLFCPGACRLKGLPCHGDVLVKLWHEQFATAAFVSKFRSAPPETDIKDPDDDI